MNAQPMNCNMMVLVTILDYSHIEMAEDRFRHYGIPINIVTHGYGAAKPELYNMLGFGENKKAIFLSIITENMAQVVLKKLADDFHLHKPGKGIAFTLPINGISNILSQLCMNSDKSMQLEREERYMFQIEEHDLILTIVNHDSYDQVIEAVRASGAKGGTILHGRGVANEETSKFLGITIQPEKDILLIIVSHKIKQQVMECINKAVGITTDGQGICISLPVNSALGLLAD
jgi:nitrogen regulatory protein PII